MQFQLTTLFVLLAAGFHAVEANKCLYNPPRMCSEGSLFFRVCDNYVRMIKQRLRSLDFYEMFLLRRKVSARESIGEKFFSASEISGKVNRSDEIKETTTDIEKIMSRRRDGGGKISFDLTCSNSNIAQNPKSLFDKDLERFTRLVTDINWTGRMCKAEHKPDLNNHSPLREVELLEQPSNQR
ncbi:hypothetical protein FG05_35220 [Fusarium graminearum]|nr:hypothetical protein FG05_35220 [Fusarium graminearum]